MQGNPSVDPFFVSLETVVATSMLLGHALESRRPIRDRQDPALTALLRERSAVPLSNHAQRRLFACAPLDVLVAERHGAKQFHVIELNGTGIGGVTNMPGTAVQAVLRSLQEIAGEITASDAVVLLGISGKESPEKPRLNKLMHEKMLFAEALKEGLQQRHGRASVAALPQLQKDPALLAGQHPLVVLGYMKELQAALRMDDQGRLTLQGRRVWAVLNDRFCLNVLDHFGKRADPNELRPINSCFLAGADKAVAYSLLNEFLQTDPVQAFPPQIPFKLARTRSELVQTVVHWLREGRKVVIKPHATGVGHGIEFFLDCNMGMHDIIARIDGSIRLTEAYYHAAGGAFPYTVCEFVDTCCIRQPGHPLANHKYELRVVVYRDEDELCACPSIVKVASRAYDEANPDRLSLINNVTAVTEHTDKQGMDFVLPLSNHETLDLLGIGLDELTELGRSCTRYVRHVLDRLQAEPERFGFEHGALDRRY